MRKRDVVIVAVAILLAAVLTARHFAAVPTGAWGLHYSEPGCRPQGPASEELLRKYGAAYAGAPGEKVLYLTFDAGYENGCTEKILNVLKKHGAPATFFLVGSYIQREPDLVRRMVSEGHTVGNHTMHHKNMDAISDMETFAAELKGVEDAFKEATGQTLPKYYRPPQGIYSESNLQQADRLGYRTVFWSLAYVDWEQNRQPTREQAFSKLLPRTHDGAVVLLHSTSRTNAEILDSLLTRWEEQGYRFAPIEELFEDG